MITGTCVCMFMCGSDILVALASSSHCDGS